jgi:streptomycin 6-kinase
MVGWGRGGRCAGLDDEALLLERAEGDRSLAAMAQNGGDEEACRIICGVAAALHTPRPQPVPPLVPLQPWFRELEASAGKYGGIFPQCAATARYLLTDPQEVVILHGDIHHGNVLDFGERGWLVIDPKGLIGERGFDYANIFCNPDQATATAPGRFIQRIALVSAAAGLERRRLLQWVLAWAGLSAIWSLQDGDDPAIALAVAEMAAAAL